MNPRRVALITEATAGGVRRHLATLALGLKECGMEVTVFAALRRDLAFGDDIRRFRQSGIPVTVVPMVRALSPVGDSVALLALLRRIRPGMFDVVHTHSSKAGFLGRLVGRLRGVPVVVHSPHLFAFSYERHSLRRALYRRLERIAAPWTTRYLCVCEQEKTHGIEAELGGPDHFCVIPNGIPDSYFEISSDRREEGRVRLGAPPPTFLVGTAGRLTEQKGHRILLEAAARATAEVPQLRLVIAGEGPLRNSLEREICQRGLASVCALIGRVERWERWVPALDVFVLPSLWEGLPYALLEAMAAGLPVVATRTGGIEDVLEGGKAGWVVPPGNAGALADALVKLARDEALRKTLGQSARRRAWDCYRARTMVARHVACYERLLLFKGMRPSVGRQR